MDILYKIVQLLVCVFEAYLMFDFFHAFFPLKLHWRKRGMSATIILIIAGCIRFVKSFNSSLLNITIMQILYLSLVLLVFEGSYIKRISCDILGNAIMAGSEFLLIIFLSHPSNFSLHQVKDNQFSMMIHLIGIKTIAFIMFNIVKRVPRNSNSRMDLKHLLQFSVVPISVLGIMVSIAYLNVDFDMLWGVKALLIISCVFALAGNVLVFYVFERYSDSIARIQEQKLMITRLEMQEKHYEQMDAMNKEHAKLLHDIHHYFSIIGEMASDQRNTEILDILSELNLQFEHAEKKVYCDNRMLNAILNEKQKQAQWKNIKIAVMVEPNFQLSHIADIDLIALMGNLLDNAIEAAEKCEDGYVNVLLFAQNDNYFSVIKIENNYDGQLKQANNVLVTSKDDDVHHGIGLQSVTSMLEKYDGYLQSFYENGVFTSVVILPVKTKPTQ